MENMLFNNNFNNREISKQPIVPFSIPPHLIVGGKVGAMKGKYPESAQSIDKC
jgi:hypothetical protein